MTIMYKKGGRSIGKLQKLKCQIDAKESDGEYWQDWKRNVYHELLEPDQNINSNPMSTTNEVEESNARETARIDRLERFFLPSR